MKKIIFAIYSLIIAIVGIWYYSKAIGLQFKKEIFVLFNMHLWGGIALIFVCSILALVWILFFSLKQNRNFKTTFKELILKCKPGINIMLFLYLMMPFFVGYICLAETFGDISMLVILPGLIYLIIEYAYIRLRR